jgi:coenzyme PQQ precursor peptide PqqA
MVVAAGRAAFMKIMRRESWSEACAAQAAARTMPHGTQDGALADTARCPCHPPGDFDMQWQTPTATDWRFGFEITLYVGAR